MTQIQRQESGSAWALVLIVWIACGVAFALACKGLVLVAWGTSFFGASDAIVALANLATGPLACIASLVAVLARRESLAAAAAMACLIDLSVNVAAWYYGTYQGFEYDFLSANVSTVGLTGVVLLVAARSPRQPVHQ